MSRLEDPLLDDELDEEEDDDAEGDAAQHVIEEQQREFVNACMVVMETHLEKNPEHRESIEGVTEGIIRVIEGNGEDEGYLLVKRTDADLALLPCTRQVYDEHMRDFPNGVGHDLSGGLLAMFEDINS